MKKKIGLVIAICMCIGIALFVLQVNAKEVTSKYGVIERSEWQQSDTDTNRFNKVEDFLFEFDETIDNICKYLNINCTKRAMILFADADSRAQKDGDQDRIVYNRLDLARDIPQIAHEATHFLTMSPLEGLSEGLACLMQDKFGTNVDLITLGHPAHSLAKVFLPYCDPIIVKGVIEGGVKLRKLNVDDSFYFYLFSHSFVKYLIDTYGLEKFMHFFNHTETETYQSVFGVDSEAIKNNWVQFINSQADADMKKWKDDFIRMTNQ